MVQDLQVQTHILISGEGQPSGNLAKSNEGGIHDSLVELYLHASQTIIATVLSYNVGLTLTVIDILKGIL